MSARARIEEVLQSIRPAIQADGGDVELLRYDERAGRVEVRLMGACKRCPISMMDPEGGNRCPGEARRTRNRGGDGGLIRGPLRPQAGTSQAPPPGAALFFRRNRNASQRGAPHMDVATLKGSVISALSRVAGGGPEADLVESGRVRDLEVEAGGRVRFSFHLRPEDPGTLVKAARTAVEGLSGVSEVKVDVQLPRVGGAGPRPTPKHGPKHGQGLQPGSVPAPTPKPGLLPEVDRIVAVSSGKGGVGSRWWQPISPPRSRPEGFGSGCWTPIFTGPTSR